MPKIKKVRKALSAEEKETRKADRAEKMKSKVDTLKTRMKSEPACVVLRKIANKALLNKVTGEEYIWKQFCQVKGQAELEYWKQKAENSRFGKAVKPLTAEQIKGKREKLAERIAKLEADRAALAQAEKLLKS